MTQPIHIVFDLDGTLFKSESVTVPAVMRAMEELKYQKVKPEDIKSLIGETFLDFAKKLAPTTDHNALMEKVSTYERELINSNGKLYSDIFEMLKELKKLDYNLSICTNAGQIYTNSIINKFKIANLFSKISIFHNKKSKSLRLKDIIKKDMAIMVGDRKHDIIAAKDNTIPSIGVAWGYGKDEVKNSSFIAKTPKDIIHIANRIDLYKKIETAIKNIENTRPIIGINGVDASGKTIFTKELKKYLCSRGHQVTIIHIDDFHNPKKIRYQLRDQVESYIKYAFNLDSLENELLKPLQKNEVIKKELMHLDLNSNDYNIKKKYKIKKDHIILLEGVLLYRKPMVKYINYKIFLDIDFDTMVRRAISRDNGNPKDIITSYKIKRIPIQKKYFKEYKPIKISNIVINNNDYNYPKIIKI